MIDKNVAAKLVKLAKEMLDFSYSPYSEYKVGAALLTKSGKIYLGCNIENASYSPTVCAERVAFFEAINKGEKDYQFVEVMACPGGCICGGGQPRPEDFKERVARADGLYGSDKKSEIRTARENEAVRELLEELGEEKHHLLHVEYGK